MKAARKTSQHHLCEIPSESQSKEREWHNQVSGQGTIYWSGPQLTNTIKQIFLEPIDLEMEQYSEGKLIPMMAD
jgi:hypothetical protein